MASAARMTPQKDFILFDDPTPTSTHDKIQLPSLSTNDLPLPSASFSKHRSPKQSPYFDDAGTLDDVGGPLRKRQRSEVYAPPSALSRSSREGTTGSSGQASNDRVTPPSGSLGAPMHDLSLGDSLSNSRFDANSASAALGSPGAAGMTREQQERVKAQIRAELAGVDTRAFKGPLRDILQKQDYTPRPNDMQTSPLSASTDPMQAGVAPSFSLFPDYDLGGQPQSQSSQSSKGAMKDESRRDEEMPPLLHRGSDLRTRSSTYDSSVGPMSFPPARYSQNYLPDWARQSQIGGQLHRETYSQQHSQQSQQQRPHMPPPVMSQSQLAQRGGPVSMPSETFGTTVMCHGQDRRRPLKRESSGLTVSPQEAFLDYDDVENALSHSGLGKMPSLFATVPPGLSDAKQGSGRYSAAHSGSNTPRMTSQQNVPRARSSTGEPIYAGTARPVPMSRNDTARQHHYQKRPGPSVYQNPNGRSPNPNQSDGRGSASQESGSQSSLFSPTPADSGDTISTDDDEDERPYYPPNMRPSMIRGGPSSLYLNYPVKGDERASASPSAMARPLMGKERTSSTGNGAWSHVRNEPWAFRQAHMNQPRFSDVSASSSDSEDDRMGRRSAYQRGADYHSRHVHGQHPHHYQHPHNHCGPAQHYGGHSSLSPHPRYSQLDPRASAHRPPLPHHQSSSASEDMDDAASRSSRPYRMDDRVASSRAHLPGALGGYGYIPGSQESGLSVAAGRSQDEESLSPSIRSSAQSSDRKAAEISAPPPLLSARQPSFGGPAPAAAKAASSAGVTRDPLPTKDDRIDTSGNEEGSERSTNSANSHGGNESDDENSPESAASRKPAQPKAAKASKPKPSAASATGTTTKPNAPVAADGTTKCDYVSPITGAACQTAFHRPYDLARHRETIHAREEAGFIREGKLRLEECVVLGKEVDPKKSTAVVEWKCKTCGANFSRKDAMLRHERLRHNAAK